MNKPDQKWNLFEMYQPPVLRPSETQEASTLQHNQYDVFCQCWPCRADSERRRARRAK